MVLTMCLRKIIVTSTLFLRPQKKSEFQRLTEEIYRPILKIYELQCGLRKDLWLFFFHSYNLKIAENCRGLGKRCSTTPHVWIWLHSKILKCWLFSFESIRIKTKVIIVFYLIAFFLLISLEKIIVIIKDASQLRIIPLGFKQNSFKVFAKFFNPREW